MLFLTPTVLELILFFHDTTIVQGLFMSKSDLKICENVGDNPHNVVDDKPCEKKLVIAHIVRSGQVCYVLK